MGLVAKGKQNVQKQLAGSGQMLFMGTCADCGAAVTLVGAAKPEVVRCPSCGAKAAAAPNND